ncbi:MucB/RseB C-terminal domain-containing protein [Halomonas beimenensis]|uniref:Sigma factor RpoE negative regulatory protein RseB n=1 Tax=Halomonas beimenensis TaxID=475662 RepID=A0A291P5X1_9GAMM|nr:MucB/RseB C-terminal domain-containing protein [Halomonas beimenensis]ATJ82272.1 sigma factor RpoE negative regulatory protein RseB precursor [Halomonas beimenensis]
MATRRTRTARLAATLLAGAILLLPVQGMAATPGVEGPHFDCAELADGAPPDSARGWYERSLWANHCYVYQARAVRIGVDGVRTLALSHEIRDGIEREVARFLDGPAVVFERQGRVARLAGMAAGRPAPASPATIVDHLAGLYRLQITGEDRIAGRRTVRLDIEPLDELRYGHRLWLDAVTALPLKQMLLDERGRVIETFQITELRDPRLHRGEIGLSPARRLPAPPWRPGWMPEGFVAQPVETHAGRRPEVGHRVYGDGLATLSLFVEPLENRDLLIPGVHRLGVSNAAVLHRQLGGRPRQVVAMGELPPEVLRRVVEAVEWHADDGGDPGREARRPEVTP